MGLGVLGRAVLDALRPFGFALRGRGRSARALEGVACFAGADGMAGFLDGCDIPVSLLPLTPEAEGIPDAELFAALPEGRAWSTSAGAEAVVADIGRHCRGY